MIKRALISVFYKDGILDFAKFLTSKNVEIVSTGGTYKYLKEKVPTIAKTQYVYDPIKYYCVGNSDFTIILSGN